MGFYTSTGWSASHHRSQAFLQYIFSRPVQFCDEYFQSRIHLFIRNTIALRTVLRAQTAGAAVSASASFYQIMSGFVSSVPYPISCMDKGQRPRVSQSSKLAWFQELNLQAPAPLPTASWQWQTPLFLLAWAAESDEDSEPGFVGGLSVPSELLQFPDLLFSQRNTMSFSY